MSVYVVQGGGDSREEFPESVERALVAHALGKRSPWHAGIEDAQFIPRRAGVGARGIIISPSLSRPPVDKGQYVAAYAWSIVNFPWPINRRERKLHPPGQAKDLGLAVGPIEKLSGHREVCQRRAICKVGSHSWQSNVRSDVITGCQHGGLHIDGVIPCRNGVRDNGDGWQANAHISIGTRILIRQPVCPTGI